MNRKGFSLIEVMIGIVILTIAIVSTSSLLNSLVHSNKVATQVLQASYFVEEGIEGMRNIRDSNRLQGKSWDAGFENDGIYFIYLNGDLGWDLQSKGLSLEKGKICESGAGIFGACGPGSLETPYEREIKVEPYCTNAGDDYCKNSKLITASVNFVDGQTVQLKAVFSDWNKK